MGRAPVLTRWEGEPRRGRALVLTSVVHACGLMIILIPLTAAGPPQKTPHLVTFDSPVPGPPEAAAPKPKQPHKVPPQPPEPIVVPPPAIELPIVIPQVVALLEQADAQAASGGCDLTAPIQAALQANVQVQKELPSIPQERRSVANAIAVWNQDWIAPDTQLKPEVLESIRSTVATTIAAASEACRLQPQGGPRLVYLTGREETTVLALGSGEWTWQQIADTAQPEYLTQLADAAKTDASSLQSGRSGLFNTAFSQ